MLKITLAILMLSIIGFVFATANLKTVNAENTGTFKIEGASVHVLTDNELGEDKDNGSAKITASLDKTYFDAIDGDAKFFTLVATGSKVNVELKDVNEDKTVVVAYWTPVFDAEGNFKANTYIANFPVERYASEFTVRAGYVVGENEVYTDAVVTSMASVANAGILSGAENVEKYLGTKLGENTVATEFVAGNKSTAKVEIPGATSTEFKAYIGKSTAPVTATIAEENGKVYATFATEAFASVKSNETATITFIGNGEYARTVVKAVDFAIGNETEFGAFFDAILDVKYVSVANTEQVHAVLTADLDLTKTYTNPYSSYNNGAAWKGSLDGQGHTIANFKGVNSADFRGLFCSAVGVEIKNVAFVNMDLSAGELFGAVHSKIIIDNCYIDFKTSYSSESIRYGIAHNSEYIEAKNSVMLFDYYGKNDLRFPVFKTTSAGQAPKFDNVIVVSKQNTFIGWDAIGDCITTVPEGGVWYKTQAELNQAIGSRTAEDLGFGEDWIYKNGYLTFKSAIKYFKDIYAGLEVVGKNRVETFTYDLKALIDTQDDITVQEVKLGTGVVDATNYSVDAYGMFDLSLDALASGLDTTLTIKFSTLSDEYSVFIPIKVADFAIGNETEFAAWFNKVQTVKYNKTNTEAVYAVLTANVDLKNTYTHNNAGAGTDYGGAMAGEFDGQGFTVNNFKEAGSAYRGIFTTSYNYKFKNVAFTNLFSSVGYLFGAAHYPIYFENCYIDLSTEKNTANVGIVNLGYQIFAENTVFKIEYLKTNTLPVFKDSSPTKFVNSYVVSSEPTFSNEHSTIEAAIADSACATHKGHQYSDAKWYATQDAANTAIKADNTLVSKFDKNYWTLDTATGEFYWTTSRATNA